MKTETIRVEFEAGPKVPCARCGWFTVDYEEGGPLPCAMPQCNPRSDIIQREKITDTQTGQPIEGAEMLLVLEGPHPRLCYRGLPSEGVGR